MGTDIHLRVQARDSEGQWRWADGIGDVYDYNSDSNKRWYSERNYDLFGILAGVRCNHLNAISEQKGWPEEFEALIPGSTDTYEYAEWTWEAGIGEHGLSWLGLDEILAYDWSQVFFREGLIRLPDYSYLHWHMRNFPERYHQPPWSTVSHPRISQMQVVEESEAVDIIAAIKRDSDAPNDAMANSAVYVRARWPILYSMLAGEFWTITVPRLIHHAHAHCDGDYKRVRIVFGFDS